MAARLGEGGWRLVEGQLHYIDDAGPEAEFDYRLLPREQRPPHHLFSPRHRALESEIIAGLLGVDNAEHTKYVKPPPTIV